MTPTAVAEAHDSVCGATTRDGSECGLKAGWGTDHVGEGRCKLHGGASPIKHGRYSGIERPEIRSLIEKHADDPDPLDLKPELATARALLENFIENQSELQDALLRWHLENESKPKSLPSLENAFGMLSEVSKIVKRIEDVRAQNALSIKELSRVMTEMGRVVSRHVDDQETIDDIREEWRTIRL